MLRPVTDFLLLLLLVAPTAAPAADLVWHAETDAGAALTSQAADRPVNPASVMKVATTLWALEMLGPAHRFVTRCRADPSAVEAGTLRGDLWVEGDGDPDFHPENAFLLAAELNRAGVERVRGALRVGEHFWIGWENGSEERREEPASRRRLMASRLRGALDPARWDAPTRRIWGEFAGRRGLDPDRPPRVAVEGGARAGTAPPDAPVLAALESKPLRVALRRFNVYSNNDIERVGELLGGPGALEAWLRGRFAAGPDELRVETVSGLGENRMTARLIVRLLRDFREACDRMGLRPADLLPVAGCDPGTMERSYPRLARGAVATAVVGKTGTLLRTDGGVAALAGYAAAVAGERLFAVIAPRSGKTILDARGREESWVLDLLRDGGGARPRTCPDPLPMPDEGARPVDLRPPRRSGPETP
ncbi:MAG: D-alanyl-D-alanine carboxypeptidase [Acidobacteriota bacterium]